MPACSPFHRAPPELQAVNMPPSGPHSAGTDREVAPPNAGNMS